jgi:hypothetical protein
MSVGRFQGGEVVYVGTRLSKAKPFLSDDDCITKLNV